MPRTIKTYQDKVERERRVRELLDQGKNQTEIARELGVNRQAIHAFLNVRGWTVKPS